MPMQIITLDSPKCDSLRQKTKDFALEEWDLVYDIAHKLRESLKPYLPAAGLAATQIGFDRSIFIYSFDRDPKNLEVVVNPTLSPIGDEKIEDYEGCFSTILSPAFLCIPSISRYKKIAVSYLTLEGKRVDKVLEGYPARIFQHEWDHLQGIVNVEKKEAKLKNFATKKDLESFCQDLVKKRKNAQNSLKK